MAAVNTPIFMPFLLAGLLIKRNKATHSEMEFIKSGRMVNNLMFAFQNRGNVREFKILIRNILFTT